MDWYYSHSGTRFGPVPLQKIHELMAQNQLSDQDLVWRSGMETWARVADVPQLTSPSATLPNRASGRYAGFWRRLVAYFLDLIFLGGFVYYFFYFFNLGGSLVSRNRMLTQEEMSFLGYLLGWLYFSIMESSSQQATVGKMIMGLDVTGLDGSRISFFRATGRYLAKVLSVMTLGIGYVMAGVTARKQALHDLVAGCLVIRHPQS